MNARMKIKMTDRRRSKLDHHIANTTGAFVLAAALKRNGVEVLFGQSIPSALYIIAPEFGMRQVGFRTENAGASMADAYARVSHKVAVVSAQNGVGASLLIGGLAEAYKASIPIVAIVQDVNRIQTDKNAFQEIDHLELMKGCAKWVRRVSEVDRIDDYVDMAFTAAASGRPGPAVLVVPIDLMTDMPSPGANSRTEQLGSYPLDRTTADFGNIEKAADLLAAAERPLIIAGGGVHISEAAPVLANLQEAASLPVATTLMGKGGVDELHPLSLGVVGYFMGTGGATTQLRSLVDEADVVFLIGNRTNQNGTDSWTLYPKSATYIHLDIDGQEVGRNYEALRLVGDAKLTLEALTDALQKRDLSKRHSRRADIAAKISEGKKASQEVVVDRLTSKAQPIRPERIMHDLDSVLTEDVIVVTDASYSSIWATNYLRSRAAGMRFITPRGLAGLGTGFNFALGAKVARPDAKVFCLAGDGGFAHSWSELETARRMGLSVVVAVLNNQILGYQKHAEKVMFGSYSDVCEFEPVDHAAIARACGCEGVRITDPADFLPALDRAFKSNVTTVLDIITDENAFPPVTSFEGESVLLSV
jgi:acetolactate synthase-1/2/3 large subunit